MGSGGVFISFLTKKCLCHQSQINCVLIRGGGWYVTSMFSKWYILNFDHFFGPKYWKSCYELWGIFKTSKPCFVNCSQPGRGDIKSGGYLNRIGRYICVGEGRMEERGMGWEGDWQPTKVAFTTTMCPLRLLLRDRNKVNIEVSQELQPVSFTKTTSRELQGHKDIWDWDYESCVKSKHIL